MMFLDTKSFKHNAYHLFKHAAGHLELSLQLPGQDSLFFFQLLSEMCLFSCQMDHSAHQLVANHVCLPPLWFWLQ